MIVFVIVVLVIVFASVFVVVLVRVLAFVFVKVLLFEPIVSFEVVLWVCVQREQEMKKAVRFRPFFLFFRILLFFFRFLAVACL